MQVFSYTELAVISLGLAFPKSASPLLPVLSAAALALLPIRLHQLQAWLAPTLLPALRLAR
jgi:hypothetical protein